MPGHNILIIYDKMTVHGRKYGLSDSKDIWRIVFIRNFSYVGIICSSVVLQSNEEGDIKCDVA
jgi:hypothetical protein